MLDRTGQRLLFVHAHPDDESIGTGATMARYAAEGAAVTLLTCTLGELGEILVPALAGLAAERADQLGGYRIGELAAAMRALGVTDHRFLGGAGRWRDSGMAGTAGNDDRRAFWRAAGDPVAFDEAVAAAVEVIREVRPQVVVTYGPDGGYGHPDHVMAHRVTMAAVDRAGRPGPSGAPWRVGTVYWTAVSRSAALRSTDALAAAPDVPFERPSGPLPFARDDAEIGAVVDASAYVAAKRAALRAHATQVTVAGDFFALSNGIGVLLSGVEEYRRPAPDGPGVASDLCAGVS